MVTRSNLSRNCAKAEPPELPRFSREFRRFSGKVTMGGVTSVLLDAFSVAEHFDRRRFNWAAYQTQALGDFPVF